MARACGICRMTGHNRNKCPDSVVLLVRRDCRWYEIGAYATVKIAEATSAKLVAAWKWVGPRADADKLLSGLTPNDDSGKVNAQ